MQAIYDAVGDRIQDDLRRPGRRHRDLRRGDRASCNFPYTIERGERLAGRSRSTADRLPKHVLETRETAAASTRTSDAERRALRQRRSLPARMPKSVLFVPLVTGGRATRRDLAPERRSRARLQRVRPAAAGDARRQPQRGARERAAGARDAAAERRAGADQQRAGGARRRARDAGDLRRRRRQDPGDLRRPGRRHRHLRLRGRAHALPVHDRARRSLPGRADAHRALARDQRDPRDEGPGPHQRRPRLGSRSAASAHHGRCRASRRCRCCFAPLDLGRRGPRPDLAPEPRPDERVLRERRPPADDARAAA